MAQARDYEALIHELLAGVAGGWSYGSVTGWLIGKNLNERDLAQWLRENGATLGADAEVRRQLGCLAGLGQGELAEVSGELVKGWEPEVEEWKEWFDRGNELFRLAKFKESLASYERASEIKPDNHDLWHNIGVVLGNLKRHDEAFTSFEQSISIKSDEYQTWLNLGIALDNLGRHEESLTSFEQSISIKSDEYQTWCKRGSVLNRLGRSGEALVSYECAIDINPDSSQAFYEYGTTLYTLGRYEDALTIFERLIKVNPDNYPAWICQGTMLDELGRYEDALTIFERLIKVNPDSSLAWHNRGVVLRHLDCYTEALVSFERAIEIDADNSHTWFQRGSAFGKLKQYEQAIASYDRAIKIKPDDYKTWVNRGIWIGVLQGYQAEINAYHQAFEHIEPETHPEGWGILQHQIGSTHYEEAKNQRHNHRRNPPIYTGQALTNYHNALQTLTHENFPKLRLETLIDTAKVYLAQSNTRAAHQCKTEAFEILRDLLNAQPTFEGKKRLQIEYHNLRQLDVDLFVASGDNIRALEAAELDKNNRLTWLLSALSEPTISPEYTRMQQLLATTSPAEVTGILYWHLSSDNLTTFILMPTDSQPLVWESDRRPQAQELAKWIKEWDTQYRDYGSTKPVASQPSGNGEVAKNGKEDLPWRKNLPDALARLRQILEIDKICAQLPATLTHLILIPHGDLHRFPLHTFFLTNAKLPNLQGCTYLPSIQIGLNLQKRSAPTRSYTPLLSVEDPETYQAAMPFARIESAIVRSLFQPHTHIDSASASLEAIENALRQPHASFHFTGHAAYNSRAPEASALALTDEPLTAQRISQLDLSSYNLITLAACETAITGREKIDTEYVGLTSAFLQAGATHILSTLWQVDEIANAWFTIYFYQQLLSGKSPAVALNITQRWLQTVTWQALAGWLTQFAAIETIEDYIKDIFNEEGKIELDRPTKYSHPYYWAAFTLTGQG